MKYVYRPKDVWNQVVDVVSDTNISSLLDWVLDVPVRNNDRGSHPMSNIREEKDRYVVEISAPGNQKSDFTVTVEDEELVVKLSRTEKSEEGTDKKEYWQRELRTKAFEKRYYLSDKIKKEGINAKYESGILIIDVPKQEPIEPISVKIG